MSAVLSDEGLCAPFGQVADRSEVTDDAARPRGFGDGAAIFERLRPQPVEAFNEIV